MKWVRFGDAGTKFLHANATIRHRRNLITSLEDASGVPQSNHEAKANILWEAYKGRLGISEFHDMAFNLGNLFPNPVDLSMLDEPFTHDEIDQVVAHLQLDKAPEPDGFNTDFVRRCWPIIKQDFYDLCHAFYLGDICLQSINGSFISLIPKIDNPTQSSHFRPISLMNISIKIITKLLANRLQRVITDLVH